MIPTARFQFDEGCCLTTVEGWSKPATVVTTVEGWSKPVFPVRSAAVTMVRSQTSEAAVTMPVLVGSAAAPAAGTSVTHAHRYREILDFWEDGGHQKILT